MAQPDRPIPPWLKLPRRGVRWARNVRHRGGSSAEMTWGRDLAIGRGAMLHSPNFFRAGDHVHIGPDFYCEVDVEIGDEVLISGKVSFVGNDHDVDDSDHSVFFAPRLPDNTVVLEGDNLIGFGATLVGDVRVGAGAVVGARSLVSHDLDGGWIYVGSPARRLRRRGRGHEAITSLET